MAAELQTWEDVRAYLNRKYVIATSEPTWLRLLWSFPAGDGNTLLQAVEVTTVEAHGGTWLRLLSVLAQRSEIDLERCLRLNHDLVVTGISLHGDLLLIRHHLPLPLSSPDELDRMVELVPRAAAGLRQRLALEGSQSGVFLDYAD